MEWEREVQKWFREDALADANTDTDAGLDGRLLLGFDVDELAVCISHARLRYPALETPLRRALGFDGPIRNLKAFAVSLKYRRQGGQVADEALNHAFKDMLEREDKQPTLVIGRIHRSNSASERFAARNGFNLINDLPEGSELKNWFVEIEPPSDDDFADE